jgi:predicted RNA-binding Zn-ribbon protein involved in translation (DUF1610 family)
MNNKYDVALFDLKIDALCTADREDEWEREHDCQSEISNRLEVMQKAELLQQLIDIYPEYLELKAKATPLPRIEPNDRFFLWACPNCREDFISDGEEKHCRECGQALEKSR